MGYRMKEITDSFQKNDEEKTEKSCSCSECNCYKTGACGCAKN
ncbi:hypothetical protein Amet_1115 [Alkaliphilus metalliredigens QYMF]|uniref:Uncharacterized protein n=1 Tax=Alkaliphilus metalliredigens (strain QYMF) TaxID=293826 RepID=A6TMA8_ALKMQ|nr:hypothetical protein Amet_1115 [Alkaliphilus metalliredigens QYMF]